MPSNASISDEEKVAVPHQQVSDQVQRILRSEAFKGSEALRHLLEYLSICSLSGRSESIKVKEIARDVFGRSESFDSQSDSVVRVHTGRLRSKLAEYYIDEGAEDDLILSVPKGSYGLTWHSRKPAPIGTVLAVPDPRPPASISPIVPARSPSWRRVLGVAAVVLVMTAGIWFAWRRKTETPGATTALGPALTALWRPFVALNDKPLIVFSTFRLAGSLDTEVHALSTEATSPDEINTYTTSGEVMGVFEVSQMLNAFGQTARAKHGRLLTWDEAKDRNLIFVGGPLAETPLRNLPALTNFRFRKGLPEMPQPGAALVDLHPAAHDPAFYPGPVSRPFRFDYGVIALQPTFNPHRRALILAGITEFGTQGAADFVSQEDRVSELLNRLHVKPGDPVPCFEALIRVNIESDVPVQYELLLVRPIR